MQNIFREFVFIFFDRIRWVVAVFATVFIISAVFAVTLPSIYRSVATMSLIVPRNMDPLQQETAVDYRNRVRRFLQDQKELILSNRVLLKVAEKVFPGTSQTALSRHINDIRENLDVVPPGGETFEGSSVFILEFQDKSPVKAQEVATLITETYLETFREITQSRTDYSHSFFMDQTQKLKRDMEEKEQRLREFETKHAVALIDILNLEPGKANQEVGPTALLSQFVRRYHELQTELSGLYVSIEAIEKEINKKGIPVVLPEMEVPGRSISVFKTKVAQLQIQMNEMKPQFRENFEPLKQVEQELNLSVDSLKKELERTMSAQKISAQSIEARTRQMEKVIADLKQQIQITATEKASYESLKQEFNLAQGAYTLAMGQREQARMARSLNEEKQFLTLIDKPVVPTKPFKPNRMLLVIGGLVSGLFLGIAVAVTVSHFDHRIKTVYELETHLRVPVLGSVSNL